MELRKRVKQSLSLFLILALTLTGLYLPASTAKAASDTVITLVETTDIHGHLVDPDNTDEAKNQYRLAYIAKQFDDLRSKGELIVLNGGDTFQGTPLSNLSKGKYLIQALEAMKCDASAVGNHEFDWGIDAVTTNSGTLKDSTIPMVACNIFLKGTQKLAPFAKEYTIVERDGKKIAIIGWADEYSADIMADRIAPYEISENAGIVNTLAKELKTSKRADAVVILAHDDAQEAAEKFSNEYIDIVFGGHSHQIKAGVAGNGLPYAQGYKEARGYAMATLTIKADGTVAVSVPKFVETYNSEKPDNLYYSEATKGNFNGDVITISNKAIEEIKPLVNEKLAVLPSPLNRDLITDSLSSPMGNWITDMLAYDQKVDFVFCNDGGIRTDFEAKTLTVNDIYTVSPFENLMFKIEMTGEQVVKLLEQIVGNTSSNMQMSGLTAKYDLNYEEDNQVFDVKLKDGTPIDLKKTYTILTNQYLATGGNEYSVFVTDVISSTKTSDVDTELIIKAVRELGKKGNLAPDTQARFVKDTKPAEVPSASKKKTTYKGLKFNMAVKGLKKDAKVTYTSSNKAVASVTSKGRVTAKAKGTTTITAKVTQDGQTFKLKMKVTVKNPVVKFTASKKTLKAGSAYTFKAKGYGVSGTVKWSSSNKTVASVTAKGKVTAKKAGTTTIKASIGKKSVSMKVTVKK